MVANSQPLSFVGCCVLLVQGLLSSLAPLVPHMAEDAWLNHPKHSSSNLPASVFLAGWAAPHQQWSSISDFESSCWSALPAVREAVTKGLELARANKTLGSSLEASVTLHVSDPKVAAWLAELNLAGNAADELKYLFITSSAHLADSAEAAAAGASATHTVDTGDGSAGVVTVGVHKAAGSKCARCWMYSTKVSCEAVVLNVYCEDVHRVVAAMNLCARETTVDHRSVVCPKFVLCSNRRKGHASSSGCLQPCLQQYAESVACGMKTRLSHSQELVSTSGGVIIRPGVFVLTTLDGAAAS